MKIGKAVSLLVSVALVVTPLSSAFAITKPSALFTPKPPAVAKPITFANILRRIKDLPAYAYNNAQYSARANAKLPSARHPVYEVKGSHLATSNYNGATTWIKKAMAMYGHFATPTKVYLFEYPEQDIAEIQAKANTLVVGGEDISNRAAAIYGTGSFGAGSNCQGRTPMRANTTETTGISNIFAGICVGSAQLDARTGVTHEFAHAIQNMQFHHKASASQWHRADQYMYNTIPCWPVEGQAVFTGFANLDTLAAYNSIRVSGNVHPYLLTGAGGNAATANSYWTPQDVMSYFAQANVPGSCETTPNFALGYSLGFLTVEALTAIGGPESHMAVVQRIAEGESLSKAFKEVYGITWAAAAPILSQVVATEIMAILDPPTAIKYKAQSTTVSQTFTGAQGCSAYNPASPYVSYAHLQALVNNQWQDVQSSSLNWIPSSDCSFISGGGYLAQIQAKIDPGTTYRWVYLGPVNIGSRDEFGRGLSSPSVS